MQQHDCPWQNERSGSCRLDDRGVLIDTLPRQDQAHEAEDYTKDGIYHVWNASASDAAMMHI